MRFAINLVFLDAEGRAIRSLCGVSPGRVIRCRGADAVLETPAFRAQRV
jgi:hypothetical protein